MGKKKKKKPTRKISKTILLKKTNKINNIFPSLPFKAFPQSNLYIVLIVQ